MDSYKNPSGPDRTDDADLNMLLYKTGRAIKSFFLMLGRGIAKIANALVSLVVYLVKNIVWLVLGAALGFGYGAYNLSRSGHHYTSEMTVRANFSSSRALYGKIDYLNSLISSSGKEKLGEIFGLTAQEASQLVNFSVEPVKSEMITAEVYKEQFMSNDRVSRVRQDTFWIRTIKYEDFKESLTQYDYPYHVVSAKTSNASLFEKLEPGIIKLVSGTELLQQVKNRQLISNLDEEKLIVSAIQNLDTLRKAYNQRLLRGQSTVSPGNQLTVLETTPDVKTPELDLFDKMLELQDELKKSRKRFVIEQDILEVYSPFNPIGEKIPFFERVDDFLIFGLLVALLILVTIDLYRSMRSMERRKATSH